MKPNLARWMLLGLGVIALGACGSPAAPHDPAGLLARVPPEATFVASVDLAALRDDRLTEELRAALPLRLADSVQVILDRFEATTGIVPAEGLDHLLISGEPQGERPWALGEVWGRFDLERMSSALRQQGLREEEREGHRAFRLDDGGQHPDPATDLALVLEDATRLRFGTVPGLDLARDARSEGGLWAAVQDDPLLEIVDPSAQAFALVLRPQVDRTVLDEIPMVGPMLGSALGGLQGASGALRVGNGMRIGVRLRTGRERDARDLATLVQSGIALGKMAVGQAGEPALTAVLEALRVEHQGTLMSLDLDLDDGQVRALTDMLVRRLGPPGRRAGATG